MFGLCYEWIDENDGYLYEQRIDWFDTKEELLEAYNKELAYWVQLISINRLFLFPIIRYTFTEIKEGF